MIKFQKTVCSSILAAGMLFSMSTAQAALFNYTITGDVILGDEYGDYNAFGLAAGDTITATGVFDDSVLSAGTGTILFGSGTGNTLTLNIGSTVFTANNHSSGSPSISLTNFGLDDFDFYALAGTNGANADFDSYLTGFDDLGSLYGDWQTNVIITPVSAVPVPAAVWLFGSGLIGLAGFARRKHNA